jgi:hypothetical protein
MQTIETVKYRMRMFATKLIEVDIVYYEEDLDSIYSTEEKLTVNISRIENVKT